MNDFAKLAMSFEGKELPIKHIPGPQGVRGRNSDNTLINQALGWAPSISIKDGLRTTCAWIKAQVELDKAKGLDIAALSSSKVVVQTTDSLEVIAAGGGERPTDKSDDPDKVQYCSRGTTPGAAGVPDASRTRGSARAQGPQGPMGPWAGLRGPDEVDI